jgi:hypothetical protein
MFLTRVCDVVDGGNLGFTYQRGQHVTTTSEMKLGGCRDGFRRCVDDARFACARFSSLLSFVLRGPVVKIVLKSWKKEVKNTID